MMNADTGRRSVVTGAPAVGRGFVALEISAKAVDLHEKGFCEKNEFRRTRRQKARQRTLSRFLDDGEVVHGKAPFSVSELHIRGGSEWGHAGTKNSEEVKRDEAKKAAE